MDSDQKPADLNPGFPLHFEISGKIILLILNPHKQNIENS